MAPLSGKRLIKLRAGGVIERCAGGVQIVHTHAVSGSKANGLFIVSDTQRSYCSYEFQQHVLESKEYNTNQSNT